MAFTAACRRTPAVVHAFLAGFAFPVATRSQTRKLSASGHDLLAAASIFGARLGFTGTPNGLLPDGVVLKYDAPAEAAIFRTLADPRVCTTAVLRSWTNLRVLACIAGATSPGGTSPATASVGVLPWAGLRALIDVGALVTGLSNKEVAAALLTLGLQGVEGVVYFGAQDCRA